MGYIGTDCGYNVDTSGSEFAYMWHTILGNKSYFDTNGKPLTSGWGTTSTSADGVTILNLQLYREYWLGNESVLHSSLAWAFDPIHGSQEIIGKSTELYAWAVRDGDVAAPPTAEKPIEVSEPGMLLLMLAGLSGLAGVRFAGR